MGYTCAIHKILYDAQWSISGQIPFMWDRLACSFIDTWTSNNSSCVNCVKPDHEHNTLNSAAHARFAQARNVSIHLSQSVVAPGTLPLKASMTSWVAHVHALSEPGYLHLNLDDILAHQGCLPLGHEGVRRQYLSSPGEAKGEAGLGSDFMAAVYEAQTLNTSCCSLWHRCSASISACRWSCRTCTLASRHRLSHLLGPLAGESRAKRSCRVFCRAARRDCAWRAA